MISVHLLVSEKYLIHLEVITGPACHIPGTGYQVWAYFGL